MYPSLPLIYNLLWRYGKHFKVMLPFLANHTVSPIWRHPPWLSLWTFQTKSSLSLTLHLRMPEPSTWSSPLPVSIKAFRENSSCDTQMIHCENKSLTSLPRKALMKYDSELYILYLVYWRLVSQKLELCYMYYEAKTIHWYLVVN